MSVDSTLRGARLEEQIVLKASPAQVWSLLGDVAAWGEWSRLYTRSSGRLAPGETLDLSIALPGLKPQQVRAEVLAVDPPHAALYITRTAGGLILGQRYLVLSQTPEGCLFRNGEVMGSLLGPMMAALMGNRVKRALKMMNDATEARLAQTA